MQVGKPGRVCHQPRHFCNLSIQSNRKDIVNINFLQVKCLLKSFIMEVTVSLSLHNMRNTQNAMLSTQVSEVRKPARKRKVSSSVAGRSLPAEMLAADIFYCSWYRLIPDTHWYPRFLQIPLQTTNSLGSLLPAALVVAQPCRGLATCASTTLGKKPDKMPTNLKIETPKSPGRPSAGWVSQPQVPRLPTGIA